MQTDPLLQDLAAAASPETLVAAILKHHPDLSAPVDIAALAQRMGIADLRAFDADPQPPAASALQVSATGAGTILYAATLSPQRRRFAIAHQLGHFLLSHGRGDQSCTARDLGENRRDTPERKAEMQANRFAAGLLMPKPLFVPFVAALGKPAVAHLPTIAAAFDVTQEAAASRYLDLSQAMCALVFVKDGVVRYARASRAFPPLAIRVGAPAPPLPPAVSTKGKPVWHPAEPRDWLETSRETRPPKLTTQLLGKDSGVRLVLLFVNAAAERRADEEAEKAAIERPKFGDGRRG
ncbi:ImmA/IrrE family metallo-endopeptidase [Sphingomonas sp. RB3P16]|uniref:ImmA/IrrE family metallo-endopeptidase n=1 Tax=Parasphingomonas frigoris TaxID=3096163 RepID=UPI002FC8FF7B